MITRRALRSFEDPPRLQAPPGRGRRATGGAAGVALVALLALGACDDSGGLAPIVGDGTFEPESLDFGTVSLGETARRSGVIRNLGVEAVMIKAVRFEGENEAFAARQADDSPLRGAFVPRSGGLPFSVLFAPIAERDYATTMVVSLAEVEVALPITAAGRSASPAQPALEPDTVAFVDVAVGREVFAEVRLTNLGERSGVLQEVRESSGGPSGPFSVTARGGLPAVPSPELEGEGKGAIDLEVHFAPRTAGTFEERLILSFDNGDPAELTVSGSAIPAGLLTCDADSIAFGAVPRGTTVTRAVHCAVSGGQYVLTRVGLAAGSASVFRLPTPPDVLGAGGVLDFTVEAQGLGVAAVHQGVVEIVAEHGAITRIPLAAEVTPPPVGATDLTVSLRWSSDATDLDLHLVRGGALPFAGSDDCYYAMKNPDWGQLGVPEDDPFLDRDTTDGFGPEEVNLTRSGEASYDVYVHYYAYGAAQAPPTIATVDFTLGAGAPQASSITLSTCGSMWHVGRFRFDVEPPVFEAASSISDQWKSRASARCQ